MILQISHSQFVSKEYQYIANMGTDVHYHNVHVQKSLILIKMLRYENFMTLRYLR